MANQSVDHLIRTLTLVCNLGSSVSEDTAPRRNTAPRDPVIAARDAHDNALKAIERAWLVIRREEMALREELRQATLFANVPAANDDQGARSDQGQPESSAATK